VNGVNGGLANGADANWSVHAASLRDGLNGEFGLSSQVHRVGLGQRKKGTMKLTKTGTANGTGNNISATPFDSNLGNFPYASGAASVLGPSTPAAIDGGASTMGDEVFDWGGNEMWYLPAGPNFFQNVDSGTGVAMTAEGGGMDLLDYMAMEPHFPGIDGGSY